MQIPFTIYLAVDTRMATNLCSHSRSEIMGTLLWFMYKCQNSRRGMQCTKGDMCRVRCHNVYIECMTYATFSKTS